MAKAKKKIKKFGPGGGRMERVNYMQTGKRKPKSKPKSRKK